MIKAPRDSMIATTIDVNDLFSSLLEFVFDFQKPREERQAGSLSNSKIDRSFFLDPIVGQSTGMTAFRAWNCHPFYSCSRALYYKTRLLWIVPPRMMIELHRRAFEECPSPSRKLSNLPITVKRDGYRRAIFFFIER